MKKNKNIAKVFSAYLENRYTEADLKELLESFDVETPEEYLQEKVMAVLESEPAGEEEVRQMVDRVEQRLWKSIGKEEVTVKKRSTILPWLSGAAAAVLVLGFIWLNWFGNVNKQIIKKNAYGYANDVLPGGNRATLVLSDGRAVALNKNKTSLRESDGTVIAGTDGTLAYQETKGKEKESGLMNTLIVPKAGSYELTLPDGSKVWVNSSSTLRFPTHFSGGERRVFVEGEAYFQVAKNAALPFRVQVGKATVQALGTQFNIYSYPRQGLKATLTEGSIVVSSLGKSVKLVPGEEAVLDLSGGMLVQKADLDRTIAWKDGYFYFKDDRFDRIMEDIADWYGLKLHYKGPVPTALFSGSVDRNANLSEVLEMVKSISKAKFEIDKQDLTIEFK